ncbi:MAG TPA: putative DNA-binding domain-containing protein [Ferruginibacter sp.]|jgi:hypothetical protein|nr:putative DNA-binding domain-containing protein [Ferruginibacter sp.]
MQLLKTTHEYQSSLASYCRSGKLKNIPGIKKENISHYRRLVYNVVDDMLQSSYPLTYDLLTKKEWNNTVNDFFANHLCQSPQVWYMPKEFYQYIENVQHPLLKKYPFLMELLSFEWMETELFMMEDKPIKFTNRGSISSNKLVLNPEHRLLNFCYPVHYRTANNITENDKRNYFVAGHRHPDGNVIFTDLSPSLVRMLEYLTESPASLKDIFQQFKTEFNIELSEMDKQAIALFFENAYQQQLIIGFKN